MKLNRVTNIFGLLCCAVLLLAAHATTVHAKAVEGVVNLNTATVKELTLLPGIGKSKAEQIIQMRQAKPFLSVDDLKAVKGLGAKRLETLRPHLVLSGPTTAKKVPETNPAENAPAAKPAIFPPPASPKI